MGSLIGGITKIFTSIGSGVATLGSAVRAVGSSLFTGMAATGTGLAGAASGGGPLASLLGGGGSVLGNMLSGAIKQGLVGGLIGGGISAATGGGFGKGFATGAMMGGISGAATGLFTPTGMNPGGAFDAELPMMGGSGTVGGADSIGGGSGADTLGAGAGRGDSFFTPRRVGGAGSGPNSFAPSATPTASTSVFPPTPTAPMTAWTGLGTASGQGGMFGGEGFAGMMQGIGESVNSERQIEALMESRELDREFLREERERRTASYRVPDSSLPGGTTDPAKRTASIAAWKYDPATGMIVKAA